MFLPMCVAKRSAADLFYVGKGLNHQNLSVCNRIVLFSYLRFVRIVQTLVFTGWHVSFELLITK